MRNVTGSMEPWAAGPLFEWRGDGPGEGAAGPVLLSVPHAGRAYAPAVLARSRMGLSHLQRLEDRHADLLIEDLAARGCRALVARVPRAVIDLNRDPRDIDPVLVHGIPHGEPLIQSAKQRGGLGLFPRSLPRSGDLWRGAMGWDEASSRIAQMHRAYHGELERALDRLCRHHGQALLVDVHSMPPLLPSGRNGERADVVIGDRFGASASACLSEMAGSVLRAEGLRVALNHPYAGSYLIERHGQPGRGRHALQIEISRDLYLDGALEEPGAGLARMRGALTRLVEALERELSRDRWSEAAE